MTDKDDDKQIEPTIEPNAEADHDEPTFEDPDDLALAEARAAVEAEDAAEAAEAGGETPSGEETPEGKAATETPPDKPDKAGDAKPEGDEGQPAPMIPKARFDEVNTELQRSREQLAYQQGILAAKNAQPAGAPAEAAKSPEDRIAEVRQQKAELATKFDDGEMTFAELTAETDKMADQEREIRAEQLRASQPQVTDAQAGGDQLYLEDRTRELEGQHPYTMEIKSKADWDFISRKAVEELAAEGVAMPDSARGDLIVRERMAVLTDKYGPMLTGKELSSQSKSQEQPKPAGGLSQAAEARKEKLVLADRHPPDLSNSGSPGTPTEYTEEKVTSMSLEDIGELPQSVRDRLAGR